jgi:hypothetical protein
MTSQSPRIYIYKITFEEVLYYYYGVHKEKKFGEYYLGSPVTHKWCWELYTPKKQILQFFDFTDEGWLEAQELEKRLIKPVYNSDKWCLNESCGGLISLAISRECGKNTGNKVKELGIGIHGLTTEQRRENGRNSALKNKENRTGIFSFTPKEKSEMSRKIGLKHKENKTGFFTLSLEERIEIGKKTCENKVGIFSQTKEQLKENGRKTGIMCKELSIGICGISTEQRSETGKKVASQRWECTETGFVTNAGNLTQYQKARGIDTSKRKRIS